MKFLFYYALSNGGAIYTHTVPKEGAGVSIAREPRTKWEAQYDETRPEGLFPSTVFDQARTMVSRVTVSRSGVSREWKPKDYVKEKAMGAGRITLYQFKISETFEEFLRQVVQKCTSTPCAVKLTLKERVLIRELICNIPEMRDIQRRIYGGDFFDSNSFLES